MDSFKLEPAQWVALALWACTGIFISFLEGSASAGLSALAFGACVCAPMLAALGLRSQRLPVRWGCKAIVVAWLVGLVIGGLAVAERLYLVNADTYPSWLASGQLGAATAADLATLRATVCNGRPGEVFEKSDQVVLRCGLAWYQPETKTYIARSFNDDLRR